MNIIEHQLTILQILLDPSPIKLYFAMVPKMNDPSDIFGHHQPHHHRSSLAKLALDVGRATALRCHGIDPVGRHAHLGSLHLDAQEMHRWEVLTKPIVGHKHIYYGLILVNMVL